MGGNARADEPEWKWGHTGIFVIRDAILVGRFRVKNFKQKVTCQECFDCCTLSKVGTSL